MQFIIRQIERKTISSGSIVANVTVEDMAGETKSASIWREDMKTKAIFPNFDTLKVGDSFEATEYVKPDGKVTLYPPRIGAKSTYTGSKGGNMGNMMKVKQEGIKEAQENKEYSIMKASTFSSATSILIALIEKGGADAENWQDKWLQIRYALVRKWDNVEPSKVANTDIPYPENNDEPIPF